AVHGETHHETDGAADVKYAVLRADGCGREVEGDVAPKEDGRPLQQRPPGRHAPAEQPDGAVAGWWVAREGDQQGRARKQSDKREQPCLVAAYGKRREDDDDGDKPGLELLHGWVIPSSRRPH